MTVDQLVIKNLETELGAMAGRLAQAQVQVMVSQNQRAVVERKLEIAIAHLTKKGLDDYLAEVEE